MRYILTMVILPIASQLAFAGTPNNNSLVEEHSLSYTSPTVNYLYTKHSSSNRSPLKTSSSGISLGGFNFGGFGFFPFESYYPPVNNTPNPSCNPNPNPTPTPTPTPTPNYSYADVTEGNNTTSTPSFVMGNVNTTLYFWGSSWKSLTPATSDKIVGMKYWYNNIQSSNYISTIREYNGNTEPTHKLASTVYDTSVANSADATTIGNQICKFAKNNSAQITLDPGKTSYIAVFSDQKRGNANFCALHSASVCTINNVNIPFQFSFFFNINDDTGCDPQSPYAPIAGSNGSQKPGNIAGSSSSYSQSQGLAALANMAAHEFVETLSDPTGFPRLTSTQNPSSNSYSAGYFDMVGDEIGDKCSWTFSASSKAIPVGTVNIGNFPWKLQGVWSNNAQNNQTGYQTTSSSFGLVNGCITGY